MSQPNPIGCIEMSHIPHVVEHTKALNPSKTPLENPGPAALPGRKQFDHSKEVGVLQNSTTREPTMNPAWVASDRRRSSGPTHGSARELRRGASGADRPEPSVEAGEGTEGTAQRTEGREIERASLLH